jgi:hypothetical protein
MRCLRRFSLWTSASSTAFSVGMKLDRVLDRALDRMHSMIFGG